MIGEDKAMKYSEEFLSRLSSGTIDHRAIITPELIELLGELAGKRALDLGCGSGRYSRFLARRGAVVTGIDRSKNQIDRAIAQETVDRFGITYKVAEIIDPQFWERDHDLVTLMFVVLDTEAAEKVASILNVAARSLKKNGMLIVADLHPHNFGRDNPVEIFVAKAGKGYFDNGAVARSQTWLEDGESITFDPNFHYRLDFLLNAIAAAGFCLDKFVEPQYRADFPTHMIIAARKL
jgi:2-polyprenyl-3-methyl-5-hydroxy-6-metoxy-1,4-benzoquinol methylase